jgi:dTDP-4-dehydrorhamnose reductase
MQKVLILGHKGMLGDAVYKYFTARTDNFVVVTTEERWGTDAFKKEITESDTEYIINCIGLIPQKKPLPEEYEKVNIDLPIFLESLGKKIIHPSTDCEFTGTIPNTRKYTKKDTRDASDVYGKSKADISSLIETTFVNTKIIRTSIIGHEGVTHLSLLDWFLNSEGEVSGFTDRYWNGITTVEWAKQCEKMIQNWEKYPTLNQYGTEDIASKYTLLHIIKEVYQKNILINEALSSKSENKCLETDEELPSIETQLQELKAFYNK